MTDKINLSVDICNQSSSSDEDCIQSVLYISKEQLKQIQTLEYVKNEHIQDFGNPELAHLWGIAFTSVLFFYFTSLGIGYVLGFLKKS
ncbi:hypothetical protein JFL47_11400 [Haemophilus haemoglobinophilus]|nr:hypothetical protein [Canicola haemoglobinophilus]MBN6711819.1 hypothetical protein [Canicola haemoglobinophilus]